MGSVPVGSSTMVAALAEAASGATRGNRFASMSAVAVAVGAALAAICVASGHIDLAFWSGGTLAVAATLLNAAGRVGGGPAAAALRQLERLGPGLDTSDAGLKRIVRGTPTLARLHAELQRQEVLAEAARAEMALRRTRIATVVNDCLALAHAVGVTAGPPTSGRAPTGSTDHLLAQGRSHLSAITSAAVKVARRRELQDEDQRLILEERGLEQVLDESARRADELADIEARLGDVLSRARIAAGQDPAAAVAEFRRGCAARRQYDAAHRESQDLRRHIAAVGSDLPTLRAAMEKLVDNLVQRGGDPGCIALAEPLDAAQLQTLETEAERAKHQAVAAITEAAKLRSRIAGLLDGLPSLADLADERNACAHARDRALHQLAALAKASAVIDEATKGVHRGVAPRLSESIGKRLSMLTHARYDAVNVDTERFAISLQSHERPELVPLEMTSHGTRDQVSLLLRLALAEVFGDGGESMPLLLDEPLLTADPQRRRRAVQFITALAGETQIVITSSDPQFAAELSTLDASAGIITLRAPSVPLTGRSGPLRTAPRLAVVE